MKRIFLLVFFLCITLTGYSLNVVGFEIRGNISGLKDHTKIKLFSYSRDMTIDSAYVINGLFTFKGKAIEVPELLSLHIYYDNKLIERKLLIGNEKVNVFGDIQIPDKIKITGSSYQDGQNKLEEYTAPYTHKMDSLREDNYEKNQSEINRLSDIADLKTIEFIKRNINKYVAVLQLSNYKSMIPGDTLKYYYNKLLPALKATKYGKMIAAYLDHPLSIGEAAHDFTALTQYGKKINFSDARKNKPTLLVFTAAWCTPCVQSIPELKNIHAKYKNDIELIAFAVDIQKSMWLNSLKREKVTWLSFWTGKGNFSTEYLKYGFTSMPSFVLINSQGKIIDKGSGYSEGKYLDVIKKTIQL